MDDSGALENLRSQLVEALNISRAEHGRHAAPAGVARAEGLLERQPDAEERVNGPRKTAPAKAVAGFARKQGVAPADLSPSRANIIATCARRPAGRMIDVLAESLPGIILKITFPKTMYWTGKSGPRFIRPIRWIVALLGDEVVPFELAGVRSGQRNQRPSPSGRGAQSRSPSRLTNRRCARTSSSSPPTSAARKSKTASPRWASG